MILYFLLTKGLQDFSHCRSFCRGSTVQSILISLKHWFRDIVRRHWCNFPSESIGIARIRPAESWNFGHTESRQHRALLFLTFPICPSILGGVSSTHRVYPWFDLSPIEFRSWIVRLLPSGRTYNILYAQRKWSASWIYFNIPPENFILIFNKLYCSVCSSDEYNPLFSISKVTMLTYVSAYQWTLISLGIVFEFVIAPDC